MGRKQYQNSIEGKELLRDSKTNSPREKQERAVLREKHKRRLY